VFGLRALMELRDGAGGVAGLIQRQHAERLLDQHSAGREPGDPSTLQPLDSSLSYLL